jgi:hypothetical protein
MRVPECTSLLQPLGNRGIRDRLSCWCHLFVIPAHCGQTSGSIGVVSGPRENSSDVDARRTATDGMVAAQQQSMGGRARPCVGQGVCGGEPGRRIHAVVGLPGSPLGNRRDRGRVAEEPRVADICSVRIRSSWRKSWLEQRRSAHTRGASAMRPPTAGSIHAPASGPRRSPTTTTTRSRPTSDAVPGLILRRPRPACPLGRSCGQTPSMWRSGPKCRLLPQSRKGQEACSDRFFEVSLSVTG